MARTKILVRSSIHNSVKAKYATKTLRAICRSQGLFLIMFLPCLTTSVQAGDDAFTDCAEQMTRHFSQKGWVGITPEYSEDGAILVEHVFADSPAEKAGVRKGDLVRGINGQDRASAPVRFMEQYDSLRPNQVTVFDLEREGSRLSVSIHVVAIPESVLEDWIQEECQG